MSAEWISRIYFHGCPTCVFSAVKLVSVRIQNTFDLICCFFIDVAAVLPCCKISGSLFWNWFAFKTREGNAKNNCPLSVLLSRWVTKHLLWLLGKSDLEQQSMSSLCCWRVCLCQFFQNNLLCCFPCCESTSSTNTLPTLQMMICSHSTICLLKHL